jgi:hypothetical protein
MHEILRSEDASAVAFFRCTHLSFTELQQGQQRANDKFGCVQYSAYCLPQVMIEALIVLDPHLCWIIGSSCATTYGGAVCALPVTGATTKSQLAVVVHCRPSCHMGVAAASFDPVSLPGQKRRGILRHVLMQMQLQLQHVRYDDVCRQLAGRTGVRETRRRQDPGRLRITRARCRNASSLLTLQSS